MTSITPSLTMGDLVQPAFRSEAEKRDAGEHSPARSESFLC